jgi:hypothetical protein
MTEAEFLEVLKKNKKPENLLEKVMDGISYDNAGQFNEEELQDRIRKEMPGYTIQTWDLDQYQTAEIFGSVVEELKWPLEQGKQLEDIQYVEEWCTDSCDAYFSILAYKTKEN